MLGNLEAKDSMFLTSNSKMLPFTPLHKIQLLEVVGVSGLKASADKPYPELRGSLDPRTWGGDRLDRLEAQRNRIRRITFSTQFAFFHLLLFILQYPIFLQTSLLPSPLPFPSLPHSVTRQQSSHSPLLLSTTPPWHLPPMESPPRRSESQS